MSEAGGEDRGGHGPPNPEMPRFNPPVILSPQSGDTLNPSFAVSGTGDTNDSITLTFSGGGSATPNPVTVGLDQTWSSQYSGCSPGGGYILTATGGGGSALADNISITAGPPPVVVVTVTPSPPPVPPPTVTAN